MPLWQAILFFGIPSGIIYFGVYVIFPFMLKRGVSGFHCFLIVMIVPLILMFVASLVAYKLEGNECSWAAFRKRYRLGRMTGAAWIWTVVLIVIAFGGEALLGFTSRVLASIPLFAPPDFLPAFINPLADPASGPPEFMGLLLKGNWWIVAVWLGVLFFNIFGEEFWWRGYILPRQELVHGKYTWIVHGVLWTLFHIFWKWNLVTLLITCLSLSFIVQRTRNTWIGIIAHFILNGMALIPIISGIIG